jgi:hypothetical protein
MPSEGLVRFYLPLDVGYLWLCGNREESMFTRSAAVFVGVLCVLAAPSVALASDPTSTVGDYEPGGVAPTVTPGPDHGLALPNAPTTELPFTGVPIVVVVLIGVMLVSIGWLLKQFATRE